MSGLKPRGVPPEFEEPFESAGGESVASCLPVDFTRPQNGVGKVRFVDAVREVLSFETEPGELIVHGSILADWTVEIPA